MKNLSMQEQKQIVGGYYCVKVYNRKNGSLVGKFYYDTENEANKVAATYNNGSTYHAIVIEIK